jgi:hypothetical protein
MKSVILRLLFFLSLLVLMFLALDSLYTFGLRHNQNLKLANVAASPQDAPLLFHGPCEPLWMISPALIKGKVGLRSYNLALSHSDFADNYLHLYLYLRHNKPPRHLFLYVTPESFDRRFNTFNTFRFAPYLDDDTVSQVVNDNDPSYYRWTFIPFMRYAYYNRRVNFQVIQGLKHWQQGRRNAYYADGFEPPAKRVWGNHAGDFTELYKDNEPFVTDAMRVKYFRKLVGLAKGHGINVHLYESPVLSESASRQPNRAEMINMIKDLAASEGVDFVQFEGMDLSRHKEYYISALSFNMKGVVLFNDTLAHYLLGRCGDLR